MIRPTLILAALIAPLGALAQPTHTPVTVAAVTGAAVSSAAVSMQLRPEITLDRDLVTYGDLIAGMSGEAALLPAFRAPALGETGTIQVTRILDAAKAAGVLQDPSELAHHGLSQIVVTRAARRLSAADIEAAVKAGLHERYGIDARGFALQIDGGAPGAAVEPDITAPLKVFEISFDARSRRLQARLAVPGSAAHRLRPIQISGQLVETVEVVVPRRAIARGETLRASDVTVERRPREGQASDIIAEIRGAVDKVARRPLLPGMVLRAADVQREEIVAKNEIITIVYEAPGLMISMRGRASEGGAMGDTVSVTNPQSKRVLQGTVIGPGRVSVQAVTAGRIARAQ